eukprot:Gb_32275 [translate_table: standard]
MDGTEVGLVSDLQIKVEKPSIVCPAEATERRSLFLSNMDQVLIFTVETVHFFGMNPQKSVEDVVCSIKKALSRLLISYDFMAGRLKLNPEQGRFEIDCNGSGALFAEAYSELSIADLQDIAYPNPALKQLVLQEHDTHTVEDTPLCSLQVVTRFKCGGFTIGLGTNHAVADGLSAVHFLQNLASLAAGKDLAVIPYTDRNLLRARSPPRIEYDHPEFIKLEEIPKSGTPFTKRVDDISEADFSLAQPSNGHIFKLFHVSNDMLNRLKLKAVQDGNLEKCSGFEAVTAYLWQTRTIALEMQPEEKSAVLFAVDMRPRMKPPLPTEYVGNAVLPAYANASAKEIERQPLSFCVQKVQEGVRRMTDSYLRSCIDWGEVYKGIPRTDQGGMFISSWWRLGFEEIKYPWGKPLYSGPVIHARVDIVLLLPNKEKNGVNIFLALQPHHMSKFEELFSQIVET